MEELQGLLGTTNRYLHDTFDLFLGGYDTILVVEKWD